MAHERKCIVDGTSYKYCNKCSGYNAKETWRTLYCSENCLKIFNVCSKYVGGNIAIADAKKELDSCDLTNKENFASGIKKNVMDIMGTVVETVAPIIEETPIMTEEITTTIEEETPVVEDVVVVEESTPVIEETTPRRKRRNRTVEISSEEENVNDDLG